MFEVIVFLMSNVVCLCVKEKDTQMEEAGVGSILTDDSLESRTHKKFIAHTNNYT